MRLKQLEYFVAAAEEGSINGAAQRLYISQPSLSRAIAGLEEECGFPLFARSPSGVRLTAMGQMVYRDVKAMLEEFDVKKQEWAEQFGHMCGLALSVKVVVVPGLYPVFENKIRKELRDDYPGIEVKLMEGRAGEAKEYFSSGRADILFSDALPEAFEEEKAFAAANGIVIREICRDAYKIAVGAGSQLADRESITREEAGKLSLACYFKEDEAVEIFYRHGFDAKKSIGYNSIEKIATAACIKGSAGCLPEKSFLSGEKYMGLKEKVVFTTVEGFAVPFVHYAQVREGSEFTEVFEILSGRLKEALLG